MAFRVNFVAVVVSPYINLCFHLHANEYGIKATLASLEGGWRASAVEHERFVVM